MADVALIPDLSEHQVKLVGGGVDYTRVDFAKLSKVVQGVILRIQYGYTHPDFAYTTFVNGCKANGIPFQSYAYFAGVSVPDAIAEAKSAFSKMDKDSEILWVDVEEQTCKNPADLIPAVQAYVDYLKQQGVKKVGLYSYEGFYNDHGLKAITSDALWIARYGVNNGQPNTPPSVYCDLWQYTSTGKLDGVAGNVDISMIPANGQKPLSYFTGKDDATQPAPAAPAPKPEIPIGKVKVVVPGLNIRGGAGMNFPVVGIATQGKIYDLFEVAPPQWHRIGVNQWVWGEGGKYLELNPQTAPAPKPAAPKPVYHIVGKGDTVSGLATHFGSTQAQIKAWNGLKDVDLIRLGQKLRVK